MVDEKIYVVIAVMAIIFLGIALFMFNTNRQIKKLEKRINEELD